MGCFQALQTSLMLLTMGFPLWGQNTLPVASTAPQRIPPPSETATAQELEKQGDDLRARKDYLDSIDYYRAAVKKEDSATLHNKMGISLSLVPRNREAKKEYNQSMKLDKTYPEPHNNLGALYYSEQRYGPAIKEYTKAIQLNEVNATFHSNLGSAFFAQKDFSRAMKEYNRALELDPTIFEHQTPGGITVRLVNSTDRAHLHYLMAQMYGTRGDDEHCRYYLSKANEEGYPIREALHDNEFAGLRKDPGFVSFVRSLKPPPQENSN